MARVVHSTPKVSNAVVAPIPSATAALKPRSAVRLATAEKSGARKGLASWRDTTDWGTTRPVVRISPHAGAFGRP